jgi:tetratricopeptide (TPR) repeat protein
MRRLSVLFLAACLLGGCGRQEPVPEPPAVRADVEPVPPLTARPVAAGPEDRDSVAAVPDRPQEPSIDDVPRASKQERYDAALIDALNLMAERRLGSALEALRAAQKIQDTEQVQRLMDRIQALIAEQTAAERTAQDLKAAINDGKADEAAKLADGALAQYGGSDAAADLARVKQQADAVVTATISDTGDRVRRLRTDALAALADNNLRSAAISLEQAAQLGEDPELKQKLDDVQARLTRYDDNLRRARDLRRDPGRLEDAIAALQEAENAWDTLQVRQEIDDYNLALQKRRDRVGIADFEVRGDLGVPGIGRAVAEEMLPALKGRFDVVERSQVGRVLEELKLEAGDLLDQPTGRREVGRLAGVKYVVVGSLTPLCGITAQARLIEVRSGIIIQTARISAANAEGLIARMPLLGQMLLMTDDQKLAFEQLQAQKAPEVRPIEALENLPPPPPPPAPEQPPPAPIVTYTPRPPAFGGLTIADFQAFPPVVVAAPPPPTEVVIVREEPRRRLFALSLELGDNLFRRGRYREADRHFQVALSLGFKHTDIQLRIDRCKPYLPPPPPPVIVAPAPIVVVPDPVVVAPPPVVVIPPPPPVRPRLVVFNFFLNCEPGLVPPNVGDLAADQCAAAFGSTYEVIDRGEVCWYMGRLGITMRDVMADSSSRIALAQALNVRFFLFGAIEQTHSFNVTTHLIDAQSGARTGTGTIHVQDHNEIKLRMNELARQVGANPDDRAKLAQQGKESEKALTDARKLLKAGSYTQAAAVARSALKETPDNPALQAVQQEAEQKARQVALAEAQRRQAEARKAEQAAAEQRQRELARAAEAARRKAEEDAKRQDEAARRAQDQQKDKAAEQLRIQAQKALLEGNYPQAVRALQSAAALRPSDEVTRELARARIEQEKAVQVKAAQEQARKEAEARRLRDVAQVKVEAERKRVEAEQAKRRQEREAKDSAAQARLIEQARALMAKKEYDRAAGALQAARTIHASAEIDRLIQEAKDGQALEDARKKGERERAAAEKRLGEEKARRERTEAEAKQKQADYAAALERAQKAIADKKYDEAVTHFEAAGKLYRTDAVAQGLKKAEELRDHDRAQRDAEARRQQEERQRSERVQALLAEGRKAADTRQFDKAMASLGEASRLAPGNVEVQTALMKVEQAREALAADATRRQQEANRQAAVRKWLDAGKGQMAARKYADAVNSFREAAKLDTSNAEAAAALRDAEKALSDSRTTPAPDPKAERVRQLVAGGRKALEAKDVTGASRWLAEAQKLSPDDAGVRSLAADITKAQTAAADTRAMQQRKADYDLAMDAGRKALGARNYQGAVNAFAEALRVSPGDRDATAAFKDAQQALDASKKPPAPPPPATKPAPPPLPNPDAMYARAMQAGATLEKQHKYADAVQAYQNALRWKPLEAKASAAVRAAEYLQHMTDGEKLLNDRKFKDAAKEFEEALKLYPTSADAKKDLDKARSGKP